MDSIAIVAFLMALIRSTQTIPQIKNIDAANREYKAQSILLS